MKTPSNKRQTTLTSFFSSSPFAKPASSPIRSSAVPSSPFQSSNLPSSPIPATSRLDEDLEIVHPPKRMRKSNIVVSDDEEDLLMDQDLENIIPQTPQKILQNFRLNTPKSAISLNSFTTPSKSFTPSKSTPGSMSRTQQFKEKNEMRYAWLLNIKDEQGRTPDDVLYDPRTLYVPKSAWQSFTPFEKQFWEIKSKHWDTVVFFKKGKFFELYENDADIGHQHFDLKLTDRVNMRMVGVPESSFHHWASQFIAKGYKVAKVEQMENAIGKAIRDKASSKKEDKVIKRELTSILTSGTLVDEGFLTSDMSTYCMSIKEEQSNSASPTFGVCFVDTATAEFNLSFFTDDENRTHLETIITQIKPKEIILEKGNLSKMSAKILRNNLMDPQYNYLTPTTEFWTDETTMEELKVYNYFKSDTPESVETWPDALQSISRQPVALSAFGGLLSYLRSLKLDKDLLSAKNIQLYDTVQASSSLILDGQTLLNLEIFQNTHDGTDRGSLFKLINHCVTPFGKRLFKRWVCHPLRNVQAIDARLDAVEDFYDTPGVVDDLISKFRKLPDLERVIARIHSGNCLVKDFVAALEAFANIKTLLETLTNYSGDFKSKNLIRICNFGFPTSLTEALQFFEEAFDHQEAIDTGKIQVNEGFDEAYDENRRVIDDVEDRLEKHLRECEKKCSSKIVFRDIGKEIYQLEVPAKAKVPRDWTVMSKTQAVHRYYNSTLRDLVNELLEAREHCESTMRTIKSRYYERFDESFTEWMAVIQNIAELDCYLGMTRCRQNMSEPICRPEFIQGTDESVLDLVELKHPCMMESLGSDFIPNDLQLGKENGNMVLLTGPNMGGKSTLLRQSCIAVIMAQLGCFIPAQHCRLTPFDRIFTRIGANDNIMAGQSTFMVELSETSKILQEATPRSLVILDELGRGTSTFDGYAIAYSVLYHLVTHIGCLGLFSTHYGSLTNDFENNPLVQLKYMSFCVDEDSQQVLFLYKLTPGKCPSSYGMNVAALAQIPKEIIDSAKKASNEFEQMQTEKRDLDISENQVSLANLTSFELLTAKEPPKSVKRIWKSLQPVS
ncbi:muts domain V-domain-containing protein [Globomyces pollinis-pini]|nr:muts domain V-domain-containing protein [Globomyces pollinis-pini]